MSTRPHVICHMLPSIDGRIVVDRWDLREVASEEYERTAETFDADAWIIGRVSMEPYAGKARVPRTNKKIARKDFLSTHVAATYAIAIDPGGRLRWTSNHVDGDSVITVLTTSVSDDYLAMLQAKNISYLFGGKTNINLKRVLEKLSVDFGIRKLLLEGGGKINGSFLEANLIDELSILVAPVADGSIDTSTLFDTRTKRGPARNLKLKSVDKLKGDIVWLRYEVVRR